LPRRIGARGPAVNASRHRWLELIGKHRIVSTAEYAQWGTFMTFHRRIGAAVFLVGALAWMPGLGAKERVQRFTAEQVEAAEFKPGALQRSQPSALALKVQVLLDRAHASPSVIDGVFGESTIEAIRAFQAMTGAEVTGKLTPEDWGRLRAAGGDAPILTQYEIKKEDVKGPFVERIPDDYKEKAELKKLSYTSAAEGLAEKFHMDQGFLEVLNPESRFEKGETITVIDPGADMTAKVERIEVDAKESMLRAYGADGKILAAYPATVGSKDMPSPSGSLKVRAVAKNPVYTYDPKRVNFREVDITEQLSIPAGPNNPVGTVWIDLDKDTYGIHGTPDPADVGKESSHGCVRLTNWDVEELAAQVREGTAVEFINVAAAQ
jgi:lipoprotein-anchoring transpeptidase ErfK/SrfK